MAAKHSGDIFIRDIALIDPDPLNTRDMTSQVAIDDIERIAREMVERGFDAGQEVLVRSKPGGRFMVTDGHKRRLAFIRALELGASMPGIPTQSEKVGTNDEDRAIIRLRAPGRRLSPAEAVIDIKRLIGWNWTPQEIADRLGEKLFWVESCLELAETPFEVREAVRTGKVATTEALRAVHDHKEDAPRVTRAAVEHAAARGKTRATGRDFRAVAPKARTEAVSLDALARKAVHEWRESMAKGATVDAMDKAMEALEQHLGPLARPVAEAAE